MERSRARSDGSKEAEWYSTATSIEHHAERGRRDDNGGHAVARRVSSEQSYTPTYAASLARIIMQIIKKNRFKPGIYHWTDGADVTWYEFAREVQKGALEIGLLERAIPLNKISAEQYSAPARRPNYSVLDTTTMRELLNTDNDDWQLNLRLALSRIASLI